MTKLLMKLRNRKGFTLIELIVVIAILGILAAILIPQFSGFSDKARTSQVLVDAKQIATAAESFYAEKNVAPTAAEIVSIAGTDIDPLLIDDIALTADNHIIFTYVIQNGTKFYAADRDTDGQFYTGVGATAAAALTAAAAAKAAA